MGPVRTLCGAFRARELRLVPVAAPLIVGHRSLLRCDVHSCSRHGARCIPARGTAGDDATCWHEQPTRDNVALMPLPDDFLDAMQRQRERQHEEAQRDRNRDLLWTAVQCMCWSGLGIFLILWSAHTTDYAYGMAAFFAGLGIGNGGIIFSLLAAYRRGELRGDW